MSYTSLNINIDRHPRIAVKTITQLFEENKTFIYPTDTIYGIGGNPFNESVIEEINRIKMRDESKSYILLVGNLEILSKYVEFHNKLHKNFLLAIWPAPVSVVLNIKKKFIKEFNRENIAFRIPANKFCLNFLSVINCPVISTSVNRKDEKPIENFKIIKRNFGNQVDGIFYSSRKKSKFASTVIDLTKEKPLLLREGKYSFEMINKVFSSIICK